MKKNKRSRYLKRNFVEEREERREKRETRNAENNIIECEEHELALLESRVDGLGENNRSDVLQTEIDDSNDDVNCIRACNETTPRNGNNCSSSVHEEKNKNRLHVEAPDNIRGRKKKKVSVKDPRGGVDDQLIEAIRNDVSPTEHLPRMHIQDENTGRHAVHLASVTLAIVCVFMVCHSIKWIPNFYEMIMVRVY